MINEEELKQEELKLRQNQLEIDRIKFEKLKADELKEKEKKEKERLKAIKEVESQSFWLKFIAISAIVLIIFMVFKCSSTSEKEVAPDNLARSIQYTEQYITELLKSPSTADFGYADVKKTSYDTYHVSNYVDCQNSFGATIRMKYECDIKWTGNDYKISNVVTE